MIKFSDISSAVPRVGQWRAGPSEGGAREPARPRRLERGQNRRFRLFREERLGAGPVRAPFPWDYGANAESTASPTPEQASFSLCTRAELPLL